MAALEPPAMAGLPQVSSSSGLDVEDYHFSRKGLRVRRDVTNGCDLAAVG
jgi:hypothetical protein